MSDAVALHFEPDWIGFDLDHTLARYKLPELRELNHYGTKFFLTNEKHYPEAKLHDPPVEHLERRGAIIDRHLGHIIFIDETKQVYEAWHGSKELSTSDIKTLYGAPLADFDGNLTQRFWPANTYFETFIMGRFAQLVDYSDKFERAPGSTAESDRARYDKLTEQLHDSLYYNYADFNRGLFFPAFRENPGKFLYKRQFIVDWVNDVHANTHCQVFLVTNSLPEFTDLLCTYIMGENWRTLFRLVIFQARKPHFFTHGCAKTTLDAVAAFKTTLHGPMQATIHDAQIFKMEKKTM